MTTKKLHEALWLVTRVTLAVGRVTVVWYVLACKDVTEFQIKDNEKEHVIKSRPYTKENHGFKLKGFKCSSDSG